MQNAFCEKSTWSFQARDILFKIGRYVIFIVSENVEKEVAVDHWKLRIVDNEVFCEKKKLFEIIFSFADNF